MLREILNSKFECSNNIEESIYMNSLFQMRKLAKESGLVMFGVLIDMDFLGAAFSIFFSICAIIANSVSNSKDVTKSFRIYNAKIFDRKLSNTFRK